MNSIPIRDVESALAAFPGLAAVAVTEYDASPDERWLVAYVTSSGAELDLPALHAHARKVLPGPVLPAAIVVLDEIPMNATTGVDLDALPTPDLGLLMPYRRPQTPRQETLCGLFAEFLGVPRCGLEDNFFLLGGRSVDAMLLAGRINATFDVKVSVADLFRSATVGELDQRLAALGEGEHDHGTASSTAR